MKGVVRIVCKGTGKIKTAVYAPNLRGNMRYNVDGKFLSDKTFDKLYTIQHEKRNKS